MLKSCGVWAATLTLALRDCLLGHWLQDGFWGGQKNKTESKTKRCSVLRCNGVRGGERGTPIGTAQVYPAAVPPPYVCACHPLLRCYCMAVTAG